MDNGILFFEKQKYKQPWIWIILIVVDLLLTIGVYLQVLKGQKLGTEYISNPGIITGFCIALIVTFLFLTARMETKIKPDGIYVRFLPFIMSFRYYSWDEISRLSIIEYDPTSGYGGWRIRLGFFEKGQAFNVSGYMGLLLELYDEKEVLIGTHKPAELSEVLHQLDRL